MDNEVKCGLKLLQIEYKTHTIRLKSLTERLFAVIILNGVFQVFLGKGSIA